MLKQLWNKIKLLVAKPWVHFSLNLALTIGAFLENNYAQVFCQPVLWSKVVLIICFTPFLLFPLIRNKLKNLNTIVFFIFGLAAAICIYCIIFLGPLNLLGLPLIIVGIGILVYVPHLFLIQMLVWAYGKNSSKKLKRPFTYALLFSFGLFASIGFSFSQKSNAFEKAQLENDFSKIDQSSFLSERIIGMHFIYHTRFNEYDGWRPPLHDPILIVGLWANGFRDPLHLSLKNRIELYKKKYPNKPIMQDCSCAKMYSTNYFNDPILQ